jgi:hypothetical protein
MKEERIKVIYIAGATRSGSTVLSNILGELDGFFNVGEVLDIWDRGLAADGLCGCGTRVTSCEVWGAVLNEAFGGSNCVDVQAMVRLRDSAAHSRHLLQLSLLPGAKSRVAARLGTYLANLEALYRAIRSVTGSKVIVDASKNPGYAYLLALVPIIDLYVVHLVRDPRAVAYSWLRKKEGLWQTNPLESSLVWNLRNMATELLQRNSPEKYLRLSYEGFVAEPQEAIKRILSLVAERFATLPFIREHEIKLSVNHTVYGNPNRFDSGVLRLQRDDEWKSVKKSVQLLVALLTWPLLLRYGYPVAP